MQDLSGALLVEAEVTNTIGVSMIRTGFLGKLYYNYNNEPAK